MHQFLIVLIVFLAVVKVGVGIKLDEWFGLKLPDEARDLQVEPPNVFPLCATAFVGTHSHIIAELNKKGKVLARWVPVPDENFLALVNLNDGTFTLTGRIIPKGATNLDNVLTVQITYSNPVNFTSCYCASVEFLKGTTVNYDRIQKRCNLKHYLDRPATNADQFFCPVCEKDQCQIAAQVPGAPDPVYQDWIFFTEVTGSITGPGIALFYQFIANSYKINADFDTCTPNITNVPLPQLACSNFSAPDEGTGWGVNGKNQNCGFGSWFNCAELLSQLGGNDVKIHIADINLDLIPCPVAPLSPSPTLPIVIPPTTSPTTTPTTPPSTSPTTSPTPPTSSPTTSPTTTPTVSPTAAPTPCPLPPPCKNITVCIPCEDLINATCPDT